MSKGRNFRSILVWVVATLLLALTATATARADEEYNLWRYRRAGNQCVITDYTGDKSIPKSLQIPGVIDGATVVGFDVALKDFTDLGRLLFEPGIGITEMPSVQGCSKLCEIHVYGGDDNSLPASITTIPDYAFVGTGIGELKMPSVTSVGVHAFEGCSSLSSITFSKDATIGLEAFAKINSSSLTIEYPGPMSKWEYTRYHHSPTIVINCTDGSKGWCGDEWVAANHTDMIYNDDCLLWEMDKQGNLNIDCVNRDNFWDNYKTQQVINTQKWNKEEVKTITLNHVYRIQDKCFATVLYDNYDVGFETIYLNPTLSEIGERALKQCEKLADLYFDGTQEQWNAVTKGEDWNIFVSSSFKEHWRCTVNFDANGHGTDPAAVTDAWSHALLTEPSAPTAAGYSFVGWYRDAACTTAWNFSNDLVPDDGLMLYAKWESIVNESGSSNSDNLRAVNGTKLDLQLTGRTLYLDGKWNTLCLPFAMTAEQIASSPLEGFTVKELDCENVYDEHLTGLEGSTLYLNFKDATSIEAGKPYIVKNATAATTLKVIATDGTKGFNNNEGYASLVDGNTGTKWCSNTTHSDGNPWVCQFQTATPVAVTGYTLTTGGDTGSNSDRNPKKWTLEAKANDADGWTVIDSRDVTANEGDALPAANTESKAYAIATDKQGTYQYFRFTVSQSGGELMQLAELTLQGTFDGTIIKNPLFRGVTVNTDASTTVAVFCGGDNSLAFTGNYDRFDIAGEDKSILYLGAENKLYYPSEAMSINAFRAYFKLDDASAATLKRTVLNFGDEGATSIDNGQLTIDNEAGAWYDISGRRLNGKPTQSGLYIVNGRKVIFH